MRPCQGRDRGFESRRDRLIQRLQLYEAASGNFEAVFYYPEHCALHYPVERE